MTITLIPGYVWRDGELDSAAKRNLAANPTINLEGTISSTAVADSAITAAKLAADAVTTVKILNGNVTNPKLAPGAVTSDKSTPGAYWYAAGTLGGGVYAVTLNPALASYATGAQLSFKADVANSGAVDVNVNALGAKNIFKFNTRELDANDILAGQIVTVEYDGTNFQLLSNPSEVRYLEQDVAFRGDISPAQITANQNDYSPAGLATASTLRLNTDASRNVTGLAGGARGRLIIIHNVGAFNLVLVDESGSSSAGNRFALLEDLTLTPDRAVTLQWDSTTQRWRPIGTMPRPVYTALDSSTLPADDSVRTFAHGLGAVPKMFQVFAENSTTEANYAVGELIPSERVFIGTAGYGAVHVYADATNIGVVIPSALAGGTIRSINKTTFAIFAMTRGSWKFRVMASL